MYLLTRRRDMQISNGEFEFPSFMTSELTVLVFFSAPDTGTMYPTPKLADFGSSRNIGNPGVKSRGEVVRRDACCMLFAPPVCIIYVMRLAGKADWLCRSWPRSMMVWLEKSRKVQTHL
jgi:hypothetical protein